MNTILDWLIFFLQVFCAILQSGEGQGRYAGAEWAAICGFIAYRVPFGTVLKVDNVHLKCILST